MEDESQYVGEIKELLSFQRSSLLTSVALSRDEQHLLVGDGSGSNVYVCQVGERLRLRIQIFQVPQESQLQNVGRCSYPKKTHCSA